ncbi:esterase/lipase family protein [Nocardia asteroides]|uniref:esterase/lipase family protein n=1 Tax=Nocardia asteroides TaxID=1824 RepID=UPI001E319097|nr:alpha/beta fold hydrolase [Nocardia asteroides]UGT60996.1 alpha/beta fold hydrolase [Nocardia asteroides]
MKHGSLVALACSALILAGPVSATAAAEPIPAVNDWNCKPLPDSAFPRPIVLIHGIVGDIEDWRAEIDDLTAQGACLFAENYGAHAATGYALNGLAPLAQSEDELALFVEEVRARTASARVDLVGHSEGGLLAGALSRRLGSSDVHTVVMLAPATHGATLSGTTALLHDMGIAGAVDDMLRATVCPACADMSAPESAYRQRNSRPPLAATGVNYHILALRHDAVVSPGGTASFIDEPGVENRYADELWPGSAFEHSTLPRQRPVVDWVRQKLQQHREG